jgi:hypothetical protein
VLAQVDTADAASGFPRTVMLLEVASPRYLPVRPSPPSMTERLTLALPESAVRRSTYWVEGGIIGGVVLGLGTFVLVNTICNDLAEDGNCVAEAAGAGAIMAFGGGVIGALIGGAFHKGSEK